MTFVGKTDARQQPEPQSAPISNVRYEITFDSAAALSSMLRVAMTFEVAGTEPVLLSLPAWTPGAYELRNFARNVYGFSVSARESAARWDKLDHDTWRIQSPEAGTMTVRFEVRADTLDNAMAWTAADFALINGTAVFFYPEGRSPDFPATVTVRTKPNWRVATGMEPVGVPVTTNSMYSATFREDGYHDLVDMPFFVGAFDLDSARAEGRWQRLAVYPAGTMNEAARTRFLEQSGRMVAAQGQIFGEIPFDTYTTLLVFSPAQQGGNALEHQNSYVGIYHPDFIGNPLLTLISGHEIFHAWNVKRLRPAELVPYRYDRQQPTPWLWVVEGISDYYADLTLVRAGLYPDDLFFLLTAGKMEEVAFSPTTSLEDASLSVWVSPRDGSDGIHYSKGSLAGLMLDILIRDATDNTCSLDGVMKDLYTLTYKHGRGFGPNDWWSAVQRAMTGGKDVENARRMVEDFAMRWVDGREAYPWEKILPLAGMRLRADSARVPRLGVQTAAVRDQGVTISGVTPDGAAARAGVRVGDVLLTIGGVAVSDADFGEAFRQRYASEPENSPLSIVVRRDGEMMRLDGKLTFDTQMTRRIEPDPAAPPKALRIREGMLRGTTAR
jgi:predicted metalloprotease with PDZ domain